jgi:hypothetical protein
MVSLDYYHWDTGGAKPFKAGNRVVHGLRLNPARIEEVASDQDEIDLLANRVALDHVLPRIEKITRPLLGTVPANPKMQIGKMKELRHIFNLVDETG